MGRWAAGSGFGSVLIFQVNYDLNNTLLDALGRGITTAARSARLEAMEPRPWNLLRNNYLARLTSMAIEQTH